VSTLANHQPTPIYKLGDRVRVSLRWPEISDHVHIRTPAYVRGHAGTITRYFGAYPNPEKLAFGRPAEAQNLYHVAISLDDLWEGSNQNASLLVEIYEHWIERLE
jgi:hypothetical protein